MRQVRIGLPQRLKPRRFFAAQQDKISRIAIFYRRSERVTRTHAVSRTVRGSLTCDGSRCLAAPQTSPKCHLRKENKKRTNAAGFDGGRCARVSCGVGTGGRRAPALAGGAGEAGASHGTRLSARRRKTSRDAVRRSQIHVSRAPGPLCERVHGYVRGVTQRAGVLRLSRSLARAPDPSRYSPARC